MLGQRIRRIVVRVTPVYWMQSRTHDSALVSVVLMSPCTRTVSSTHDRNIDAATHLPCADPVCGLVGENTGVSVDTEGLRGVGLTGPVPAPPTIHDFCRAPPNTVFKVALEDSTSRSEKAAWVDRCGWRIAKADYREALRSYIGRQCDVIYMPPRFTLPSSMQYNAVS